MRRNAYRLAVAAVALPLLAGCLQRTPLEDVLASGELRVLTRNAATAYYEGPDGPTGLEYDLAKGFADELGVRLSMVPLGNVAEVLKGLRNGKGHLAAAGLTVTASRQEFVRFTPPYQQITPQLVYRIGSPRPASLALLDGRLEVMADSSHAERLRQLNQENPRLRWSENGRIESEELLNLVAERLIDYTVADSHELRLAQRFQPELRAAFDLAEPEPLAWAFPRDRGDVLYRMAVDYFERLQASGRLAQLVDRHYGHMGEFDYVGTRIFMRHVRERLPRYRELIEKAAADNGLDWRLLAAVAYQESHWNPKAVSPTGVRGFMMLTQATAEYLGIDKRTDLVQSVEGGARYLRKLIDKVPERIAEPDRTWFALAAYNVGYGHLNDARIITQQQGSDPDKWRDVKDNLPLLRKRAWYSKTKHGYARGNEAVIYVENIRSYYDTLVWLMDQQRPTIPLPPAPALQIANPVL
jgi:membrane-bound lytic murein transglycosylase F